VVARTRGQAGLGEHGGDPAAGYARVAGEHPQVVAAREERVEAGRLDHRAHPHQPVRRAGRLAQHDCAAGGRAHEPEQHPQRRRLAGAVGAEEAVHLAAPHAQIEPVDCDDRPVPLCQRVGFDHKLHAARIGRGRRIVVRPEKDPG
jgi:hypothetical protein